MKNSVIAGGPCPSFHGLLGNLGRISMACVEFESPKGEQILRASVYRTEAIFADANGHPWRCIFTESDIRKRIEVLIQDAHSLLGPVVDKRKPSDDRARSRKSHWSERHRFLVLLDAAQQSFRMLPAAMKDPWLVAELAAILDIVRIWKHDPHWQSIERSLANPLEFSHTIAVLTVAEHLKNSGHRVELVPTGPDASPD